MAEETSDISPALQEKLAELKILQESVLEAKGKADSYYDQLLRLTADFDNFRKRCDQRIEQARAQGKEEMLENVLSFADALEQAQRSITPDTPVENVVQGLKLLAGQMEKMLKANGMSRIPTKKMMFDPHLHEAVERAVSMEPEGMILEEVQAGYSLNGRVLRHARVRVASPNTKS